VRQPSSRLLTAAAAVPIAGQWLRFAIVGASNTVLSTGAYAGLRAAGVNYLLAATLAFALGALNSYALNRRWTFRSQARRAPELARFLCTQLVGLACNLALLAELVEVAGVHQLVAQALAFPAASAVTFALSRQWAFAAPPSQPFVPQEGRHVPAE
jgi:putative flippase GtrA